MTIGQQYVQQQQAPTPTEQCLFTAVVKIQAVAPETDLHSQKHDSKLTVNQIKDKHHCSRDL